MAAVCYGPNLLLKYLLLSCRQLAEIKVGLSALCPSRDGRWIKRGNLELHDVEMGQSAATVCFRSVRKLFNPSNLLFL